MPLINHNPAPRGTLCRCGHLHAFVREQPLARLIRRWHAEDCIPDEALAEAERILKGAL
ncbi:MAG: hypothetical protein ACHQC8_02705 [Solirubrobacterales bacterium]